MTFKLIEEVLPEGLHHKNTSIRYGYHDNCGAIFWGAEEAVTPTMEEGCLVKVEHIWTLYYTGRVEYTEVRTFYKGDDVPYEEDDVEDMIENFRVYNPPFPMRFWRDAISKTMEMVEGKNALHYLMEDADNGKF